MLFLFFSCAFVSKEDLSKRIDPDGDGVSLTEDCYNFDGTVGELRFWYRDMDGDGIGVETDTARFCIPPDDTWVQEPGDCDDAQPGVFPDAIEIAGDGIDQNCDDQELCFLDSDEDGFPSTTEVISADPDCSTIGLSLSALLDCDDLDADTHPGAAELDSQNLCMRDADDDGYGDLNVQGTDVVAGTDCDDDDRLIHPAAVEICDEGIDNNCNDVADDLDSSLDLTTTLVWYRDGDGDGYGDPQNTSDFCVVQSGFVSNYADCNDSDTDIHPDAIEIPIDGLDQNCDQQEHCYADSDYDGFGMLMVLSGDFTCSELGLSLLNTDCDDTRDDVFPGTAEDVGDGVDQNCDGIELCYEDLDQDGYRTNSTLESSNIDCSGSTESLTGTLALDCDDTSDTTYPGAAELDSTTMCMKDQDQDGYGAIIVGSVIALGTDCNDEDATRHPAATEIAGDGVDQNCDGTELCYEDLDQDGYRSDDTILSSNLHCTGNMESLLGTGAVDCNDNSDTTYPGAATAEANSSACMQDGDLDGFGDDNPSVSGVTAGTDCNDSRSNIHPNTSEIALDGIDQDCDGSELCYEDSDGDGYGGENLVATTDFTCSDPYYASSSEDCDDSDASIFPFADEVAGMTDHNCDGFEATDSTCFSSTDSNETYFLFCDEGVDWDEARDRCADHGYTLTSIRSGAENSHVYGHMLSSSWIGFIDTAMNTGFLFCSHRYFEWVDSYTGYYDVNQGLAGRFTCSVSSIDSSGFVNWEQGEPNNYSQNEDCSLIRLQTGQWRDVSCGLNRSYICSHR